MLRPELSVEAQPYIRQENGPGSGRQTLVVPRASRQINPALSSAVMCFEVAKSEMEKGLAS